jgi:hypothetical protein
VEKLRKNCDGGHYEKRNALSLLLEKKKCFIRLPPDTLQIFQQLIQNLSPKVASKYVGAINLIQEVITTSHRPTHQMPFDFTEKVHFAKKLTP